MSGRQVRALLSGPRIALLAAVLAGLTGGCAIADAQKDIQTREQRIQTKQQDLDSLMAQNQALKQQTEQLIADLNANQIEAEDLEQRLDNLRKQNRALQAANEKTAARQAQIEQRLGQLQGHAHEVVAARKAGKLTPEESAKQTRKLRDEIYRQLQLQLNAAGPGRTELAHA